MFFPRLSIVYEVDAYIIFLELKTLFPREYWQILWWDQQSRKNFRFAKYVDIFIDDNIWRIRFSSRFPWRSLVKLVHIHGQKTLVKFLRRLKVPGVYPNHRVPCFGVYTIHRYTRALDTNCVLNTYCLFPFSTFGQHTPEMNYFFWK